jgi:hypothetical protein
MAVENEISVRKMPTARKLAAAGLRQFMNAHLISVGLL